MTEVAATFLDKQGIERLGGTIIGDFGDDLPTGWTQDDQDPANVETNGGNLSISDGTGLVLLAESGGVLSRPDDGSTCYTADGDAGATVALDAGGLDITEANRVVGKAGIQLGITSDGNLILETNTGGVLLRTDGGTILRSDTAGSLSFYGKAVVPQPVVPLTTPDVQDVIDALVALGLVTQSD